MGTVRETCEASEHQECVALDLLSDVARRTLLITSSGVPATKVTRQRLQQARRVITNTLRNTRNWETP